MDKLYIIMPAYNEEGAIEKTVGDWYPIIERHNGNGGSRLIIFNDGSKDRTSEIGKELMKKYPLMKMIDKKNSGHGATLLTGYKYALKNGADYVFQTDSDGQTDPGEFETFWENREKYGAVIGHRNNRKDGFSRFIVTKVLKLVLWIFFGISVTDANTPYRLMRRELLEKYIPQIPKGFFLSNVMLTVLFIFNDEKVLFVPVSFGERKTGVNSINIKRIAGIGLKAVFDFWILGSKMKKNKKQKQQDGNN